MVPAGWPFFFFNDTATTEIYTLSLHDALPISAHHAYLPHRRYGIASQRAVAARRQEQRHRPLRCDPKSTRLNSSHRQKSYAVFFLQKKTTLLKFSECVSTAQTSASRDTLIFAC